MGRATPILVLLEMRESSTAVSRQFLIRLNKRLSGTHSDQPAVGSTYIPHRKATRVVAAEVLGVRGVMEVNPPGVDHKPSR